MVAEWFGACVKFQQTLTRRPGFEYPLGITISIAQSQKWLVTIQILGRRVTCVAYDIKPSVDAILPQSYTAGPHQVQASRHHSSGPNKGSKSDGRRIKKKFELLMLFKKYLRFVFYLMKNTLLNRGQVFGSSKTRVTLFIISNFDSVTHVK